MRKEFTLSDDDYRTLLDASKPTPAMWDSAGRYLFGTPEQNAARAWRDLGRRMGFNGDSVEPVPAKGDRYFTAETVQSEETA